MPDGREHEITIGQSEVSEAIRSPRLHIVYLVKRPLETRDLDRFGIASMLERGHDVAVMDLSALIHPELAAQNTPSITVSGGEVLAITTRAELKAQRPRLQTCDLVMSFIDSFGLSREILPIFKLISECRTPYLTFAPTLVPGISSSFTDNSLSKRAQRFAERLTGIDPINSVLARIPCRWAGVRTANFIVYCGLATGKHGNLVDGTTRPIYAHTHDYDLCRRNRIQTGEALNQAVFIDQFLPFHPDAINMKVGDKVDPEAYFSNLRRLFDRIEGQLGLKVVVAAHPRADYSGRGEVFGDRQVVTGETNRLIAESRLVVAHMSTSIGMALVYRKPVLLVTDRAAFEKHVYQKHAYQEFAQRLGVPLNFIDDPEAIDLSSALTIDDDRYDHYIRDFLKHPKAPDKPLWDIVHDEVAATLPVH